MLKKQYRSNLAGELIVGNLMFRGNELIEVDGEEAMRLDLDSLVSRGILKLEGEFSSPNVEQIDTIVTEEPKGECPIEEVGCERCQDTSCQIECSCVDSIEVKKEELPKVEAVKEKEPELIQEKPKIRKRRNSDDLKKS